MSAAKSSDILKIGYLVKLKTNKKKFFILRKETDANPSQLEYYDSEKKYKSGGAPKRAIILKNCFNINKKTDCKQKFVIAIYTKEDCFSVQCKSEEEREEWLAVILKLQKDNIIEGEEPRPFFEHIWQVNVKPRGLGNGKNLSAGLYRLCLTNKTLSLVRLNQQEPDIVFQLASLRRCGHSDCFFFMEAGSSAVTGAGELWMQVEDTVIAQNIHETILSSMRSRNIAGDQPFRPRSRSSVSDRRPAKPISVPSNSRGTSPGYESATLPKRSKTISGEHPGSPTSARLRPGNKMSGGSRSSTSSTLGRGHSPVPTSPLSQALSDAHRSRTDSMESRGSRGTSSSLSADEFDLSPLDHHSSTASTRSVTPEGGLREDATYLPMTPTGMKETAHTRSDSEFILPSDIMACSPQFFDTMLPYIMVSPSSEQRDGYMEMTGGFSSSRDGYMDMSPGDNNSYFDMQTLTSISSSPAVSTTSSGHDTDDHGYLDMGAIAHSLPTVQERISDAGYLDMSHGSPWSKGGPVPRPDRVQSYLSDDQSSACSEDFPKRAYSVGSKPVAGKSRNNLSYIDMSGRLGNLDKVTQKSSSAPLLVDKEKNPGHESSSKPRTPKEFINLSAIPNRDLLMEFDFFKREGDSSSFRPRTSSAGKEFRPRTSSIGQEMRRRAGSFGRDSINRTASIGRHDRQRTTSVCQDAFRARTSSFGSSSDARPRSSSYGSRSHYKGRITDKGSEGNSRNSSRHSSQESVRRSMQRASEELANRSNHDVYIDMNAHRTPSPSAPTNPTSSSSTSSTTSRSVDKQAPVLSMNTTWREDEYFSMTPGQDTGSEGAKGGSYMEIGYDREQDRSKDKETVQRRRSVESALSKNSSLKGGSKPRTRSNIKPQPHRMLLRMPSNESSPGSDQQRRNSAEPDLPANKSPGEYIDLEFSKVKESKPISKQKSHDEEETKVLWTCQPDGYAVFAPGGDVPLPSSPVSLEDVVCPLRLDEEDDSDLRTNVNKSQFERQVQSSPNTGYSLAGLKPLGSLSLTPQSGQSALLGKSPNTPTDPFNLINPPQASDFMTLNVETPPPHPTPVTNTMVGQPDAYVEISTTRASAAKSRKSPVLPPKIRTKSQKHLPKPDSVTGKPVTLEVLDAFPTVNENSGTASLAEPDYMDCSAAREPLKKEQQAASSSTAVVKEPVAAPFGELVSHMPVSCLVSVEDSEDNVVELTEAAPSLSQVVPRRNASSSSLSSVEPVMSTASVTTPAMPSRGSTSSLPSMDTAPQGVLSSSAGLRMCLESPFSLKSNPLVPKTEGCDTEGLPCGEISHHSSHTSVSSDKELNYASLDLASSMDEASFPTSAEWGPRSPLLGKNTQTAGSEEVITPLAYAEIDFNKSEELRTATSLRERVPFDVK